jgi:oligosaccharide repeat unit polymerase
MNDRATISSPIPTWWISLALAGYLILFIGSNLAFSVVAGIAIGLACVFVAWRGRIFSIEGYLCALAIYYWLGIGNPFHANVHDVDLSTSTVHGMVVLILLGLLLVWVGAQRGRQVAVSNPPLISTRLAEDPVRLERVYRAALTLLASGTFVAVLCYARLGIPALADDQDFARTAFVDSLSPYTYYQWLLVEIGIGLAALYFANERGRHSPLRRWLLLAASTGALVIIAGVSSRVTLATPIVLGTIVWWSQGRRIPWYVVAAGAIGAILVVGLIWIIRIRAIGSIQVYGVDFDFGGGPLQTARTIAAALSIFARTSVEVFGLFLRGDLPKLRGEIAFMSIIALLPGRQANLGLFHVSGLLGYETYQGTTVSLFGGMYADFGVLGIVLLSPLLGFVLGFGERRAETGDGLAGLPYAVLLSYYLNMIYGGQMLDVTLLWKLWIAMIVVRYIRTGYAVRTRVGLAQGLITCVLYAYGLVRLALV